MARVSSRAFARQVNAGGGSRTLRTREPVEPTTGFAVSYPNDKGLKTERAVTRVTGKDVARHAAAASRSIAASDPDALQGGWRYGRKTYLDVSHVYPDQHEAMAVAREHKQIAAYDFAGGRSLYTGAPQGVEGLRFGGSTALGYTQHTERPGGPINLHFNGGAASVRR